tara:strand:+ start:728 stop:1402 length:675 start_codon:yes stop_codon:yes gene_type:complete
MNIIRICIAVHFSYSIIFSQWSSFQIENMNNADSYKTNGLAALISSFQYYPFDNEKNFHFGSTVSGEISTTRYAPHTFALIKLTWNLILRGRMSGFSTEEGAAQLFGWGMSLNPGSAESPANWMISFDSGFFRAHNQINLSALKFSIDRFFLFDDKTKFIYGLSMNSISNSKYINGKGFSTRTAYQINQINTGIMRTIKDMVLFVNLSTNNKSNYLSFSILKSI